jgi:predicted nucleotidyltransferase
MKFLEVPFTLFYSPTKKQNLHNKQHNHTKPILKKSKFKQQHNKNINMKENKPPFLDQIVDIIVSSVMPDKIILFGSYARGDYNKNSDLDILILKKGLKKEREITNNLYQEFFNKKINITVDLIAIDYNKYNKLNNDIGYIYKTIKQEGKIIYE